MDDTKRAHRARIGTAVMDAIIDMHRAPDTGVAVVDPEDVRHALVLSLAMLLEADPSVRTPKDVREAADAIAREIRVQLRALRDHHERTGERAWDARPVQVN